MAAIIRGLVLVWQQVLRADLLYILLARAYFPRYTNMARFLNDNLNPPGSAVLPYSSTTIIEKTETETESLVNVPTMSISSTETAGLPIILTEFVTITTTQSTPSTETITIRTSETITAYTAVATSTTHQAEGKTTASLSDSVECNFPLLYMGASLLRPPLNVSAGLGLEEWEPAVHQLRELRRLLNVHREILIKRQGYQEFAHLYVDLEDLIEKPLRYGCSMLQGLQAKLLKISTDSTWFPMAKYKYRSILANTLQEVETELLGNISGAVVRHLLPSWAREAPELRSESCPNQDCFKIDEAALDFVTIDIPYKLLTTGQSAGVFMSPFNVSQDIFLFITITRPRNTFYLYHKQ